MSRDESVAAQGHDEVVCTRENPCRGCRELPPAHPIRRQVEEGSAAARAAMPSVKLTLPDRQALSAACPHCGASAEKVKGFRSGEGICGSCGGRLGRLAAPEFLSGDDGDSAFVRCDLANSPRAALTVGLREGVNLAGREVDEVEMLPVPEHFTEIDYEWAVVKPDTPHAVRYWRFRV